MHRNEGAQGPAGRQIRPGLCPWEDSRGKPDGCVGQAEGKACAGPGRTPWAGQGTGPQWWGCLENCLRLSRNYWPGSSRPRLIPVGQRRSQTLGETTTASGARPQPALSREPGPPPCCVGRTSETLRPGTASPAQPSTHQTAAHQRARHRWACLLRILCAFSSPVGLEQAQAFGPDASPTSQPPEKSPA